MRMRICAAVAATAWACTAAAGGDRLATRGGWELGVQSAAYEYDEPNFATLDGARLGVSAAFTFLDGKDVYSRLEARYSYAELDYTGSGTLSGAPDHLFEVRGLAGCDYRWGRYVLAPYAGVGFRYLYNDLRGTTSTGARGYRRRSRYLYLPLGLALRIPLGNAWVMVPQIEFDAFAHGRQRSELSDAGDGLPDVVNQQGRGRGVRAQLGFEGPRWGVSVWSHYWKIKNSDVQPITSSLGILEPANTTHETGVELRYRF